MCAKICPIKKVIGKKRSEISQFIGFLAIFQDAITFFYENMPLGYVVEFVEFYRFVYFQVNRAIQIFWPFS